MKLMFGNGVLPKYGESSQLDTLFATGWFLLNDFVAGYCGGFVDISRSLVLGIASIAQNTTFWRQKLGYVGFFRWT